METVEADTIKIDAPEEVSQSEEAYQSEEASQLAEAMMVAKGLLDTHTTSVPVHVPELGLQEPRSVIAIMWTSSCWTSQL